MLPHVIAIGLVSSRSYPLATPSYILVPGHPARMEYLNSSL